MRVVLDTNIFLSGLISPDGVPDRLIRAWLDRRFLLVSHSLQLDEMREVSRREKIRALVRPVEAGRLVNQIARLAEIPTSLPIVKRSRDPSDDFLLALCDVGVVDRLVTGDKNDLLALKRHGTATILTAAAFARELGI